MILSIGEILYDVFPGYKRLGGAPFNVAFHLKSLGAPVCFASRVGADPEGDTILQQLQKMGFDIDHIQIDETNRTGEVLVTIDENSEPNFNIASDVAYDYIEYEKVRDIMLNTNIDLIYFGSLVQRSEYGFATLQRILLSKKPETKCLYDVNLRPECFNKTTIDESIKQADLLKVNETELETIKQILGVSRQSDKSFIELLMERCHIEMVAVTRGSNGSDLFTPGDHHAVEAPRSEKIINSVGAGDAYSTILAIGCLCGWLPEKILSTATAFAARLCEIDGAIPTSASFYDDWRIVCDEAIDE